VLGRHLSVPLVALLLMAAGCGSDQVSEPGISGADTGATRQISGNWAAILHQKGLGPFQIAVDITADGTARVAYSGIECGGDWSLDGVQTSAPPRYVFAERISEGAGDTCKGTGTVSLSPIQRNSPNEPAYSRMRYRFTGGGVESRGLLRRTDTSRMDKVFGQAGLSPP